MEFKEFAIPDLFDVVRGKSGYTRGYARTHPGEFPVYSASREAPLAYISTFDHDGKFLSWTTNGYAGYVQVLEGKFSINSDRGLLIPRTESELSLDYCRLVMQPNFRSLAIGRIIDGKKNEYTKLGPNSVSQASILLPVNDNQIPDKAAQEELAVKYLKIERFKSEFDNLHEKIANPSITLEPYKSTKLISISDEQLFDLQIGERVLKKDIISKGIPVYSANVNEVFGYIKESNLTDFSTASLIWGIDGIFDWNIIPPNMPFAATDHCGVLKIKIELLDPEYVFFALKTSKDRYGFDRTYRASLENMKEVVTLMVPVDDAGNFDLTEQKRISDRYKRIFTTRAKILDQLTVLSSTNILLEK